MNTQSIITVCIGVASLICSVIAPTLYISDIKEKNAVQDNQIFTLQETYKDLRTDNQALSDKLDRLLIANGLNPYKSVSSVQ